MPRVTLAVSNALYHLVHGPAEDRDTNLQKLADAYNATPKALTEQERQSEVASLLNDLRVDPRAFAEWYMREHRSGQQMFMRVAWAFIKALSQSDGVDPRNQGAKDMADFLVGAVGNTKYNVDLSKV